MSKTLSIDIDLKTPFNHVAKFRQEIKEHREKLSSAEGQQWLSNCFARRKRIVQVEREVLLNWDFKESTNLEAFPETTTAKSFISRVLFLFTRFWIFINLLYMGNLERQYESARVFYHYLLNIQKIKSFLLKVVEDDFDRLMMEMKKQESNLLQADTSTTSFVPSNLSAAVEWLPDKTFHVPYFRGLSFLRPKESIKGKKLTQLLNEKIADFYTKQISILVKKLNARSVNTTEYIQILKAYQSEEDESAENITNATAKQRIERLVNTFTREFKKEWDCSKKDIEFRIVEIADTIVSLRTRRWISIKRKLWVSEGDRLKDFFSKIKNSIAEKYAAQEEKFGLWLNEKIKPAMGLTQTVKIQSSFSKLDDRWINPPVVPDDLSDILLDRHNPSLMVVPDPIVKMLEKLKTYYKANGSGNLLYITDHQTGSFGLIAYLIKKNFSDLTFRVYRQKKTMPIKKLAEFKEDVILLDDFEKMIYLDEDNIQHAANLILQILESDKLYILSIHHATAEQLRLAVPAFSRFLFQVDFSKYEFESFREIIAKRMVVSGYTFEYNDENEFWSKLYQASSGIPGIGLKLLLRCVQKISQQTVNLEYNLPGLKDFFSKLSLEELLLLKRIYMHPMINAELLADYDLHSTKLALSNLKSMNVIVEHYQHFEIRAELVGGLRDYLIRTNLI